MKKSLAIPAVSIGILLIPIAAGASATTSPAASTIYSLIGTSTPVESAAIIEKEITSLSPKAEQLLAPVFSAIDAARIWTAGALQRQIFQTAPKLPGNAFLIPANANALSATNQFDWHRALATLIGVLWTLYFYILIIVRFLIAKALICYPLVVAIVFYILYRLLRRAMRPRWKRK